MNEQKIYCDIVKSIINKMKRLIGPVAITQAKMVNGLNITKNKITIKGDYNKIINEFLSRYERIIGPSFRTIAIRTTKPILKKYQKLKALPDWLYNNLMIKMDNYINNF